MGIYRNCNFFYGRHIFFYISINSDWQVLNFKRRIFINGKLIKITATDKKVEITY